MFDGIIFWSLVVLHVVGNSYPDVVVVNFWLSCLYARVSFTVFILQWLFFFILYLLRRITIIFQLYLQFHRTLLFPFKFSFSNTSTTFLLARWDGENDRIANLSKFSPKFCYFRRRHSTGSITFSSTQCQCHCTSEIRATHLSHQTQSYCLLPFECLQKVAELCSLKHVETKDDRGWFRVGPDSRWEGFFDRRGS